MNLLKYEFIDAAEGSYNFILSELVREVRHYYSNVPGEEFKAAIPKFRSMEAELQEIDAQIARDKRFYLQEIMEELDRESKIPQEVIDESERLSKAIVKELFDAEFSLGDFHFEIRSNQAVLWMEFYGYRHKQPDSTILVLKDVFRSVCYKYDIIFIDFS